MELFLSERDHANTVFLSPDGRAVYHTDTPVKLFSGRSTKIYKHNAGFGGRQKEMGLVELHGWGNDVVDVGGRSFQPYRAGIFSTSEEFVASNNCLYKWKNPVRALLSKPDSQMIAFYDPGSIGFFSKGHPPKLTILPQGMPIADEIVTTLIYMAEKSRQRKRRARRRAGGTMGGTPSAGGSLAGSSSF
ncbi:hypothetical protein D9758_012979 [Tetrapyrgos nigripes]|uniref:DUF6593 domain-containing protein n=1 Tax=Tetrapyrgos nigripes TaxID=182062 RepID=A0A8H5FP60_9AGAR|nr:hypothetical protein D9758_012979 [Tetrapyrgos nigripes]